MNKILKKNVEFNFKAKKSLGQNFLISEDICDKIVNIVSSNYNDAVVEVGPGFGILTRFLAKKFKKVVAVEIDKKLFDFLSESFQGFENVSLINYDAMLLDIDRLFNDYFKDCENVVFCSNLPYCITSPLLMKVLESERFAMATIMIQKEAADRILAPPGVRECGAISTAVRYYSVPEFNFSVHRSNFTPVPNVDSSVVSFRAIKRSDILSKKIFFRILKSAFKERRKNILNSISSGIHIKKPKLIDMILQCGLNKSLRAENLSFDDFVNLSNMVFQCKIS